MKIKIKATKEIDVKMMNLHLKVRDEFHADFVDADGNEVLCYSDYVPDFMPGDHYGDYVILDIDLDTGMIKNWKKIDPDDLAKLFNKDEDE